MFKQLLCATILGLATASFTNKNTPYSVVNQPNVAGVSVWYDMDAGY